MFGGRDYAYLTIAAPGAPVTAIDERPRARAPSVLDTFLPVATALLALLFAGLLVASFRRRAAGEKLLWACGFGLFAVAAASEALAQRSGWSAALFRSYYLAGGVLTVAYLGAGSAWLQLPRRARDLLAGGLAVATLGALLSVLLAPVHGSVLAAAASGRPPANGALGGHAFLWAVALNSVGTLALVGGALYSIVRRRRVRANVWIGGARWCSRSPPACRAWATTRSCTRGADRDRADVLRVHARGRDAPARPPGARTATLRARRARPPAMTLTRSREA